MNIMGQRIREKRQEKGLSLDALGKLLGVQRAAVSKWELGAVENISQTKIKEMAKIFDCSPSWLMGFDLEDGNGLELQMDVEQPKPRRAFDPIIEYGDRILKDKPLGAGPRHRQELEEDKPTVSEFKEALELYRKYKEAIPQVQDAVDALLKVPKSDP